MRNTIGSRSTKNLSFSQEEQREKKVDPYGLLSRQRSGYLGSPTRKEGSCGFSLSKQSINYNCFSTGHLNNLLENKPVLPTLKSPPINQNKVNLVENKKSFFGFNINFNQDNPFDHF